MIPNLGASGLGPAASMIVALFAWIVLGLVVIPWTVARNSPQLRTRGRITVALMAVAAALAGVAAFAPYEQSGRSCPGALPAYGLRLEALATLDSPDRCAVAGQMLVVFARSILLAEAIGLAAWACSRDPVLDAPDR